MNEALSRLHDRVFVALHLALPLAALAVAVANVFFPYKTANLVTLVCVVFVAFPLTIYWTARFGFCAVRGYRSGTLKGREEALAYAVIFLFGSFFTAAFVYHLLTRGFVMPAFLGD